MRRLGATCAGCGPRPRPLATCAGWCPRPGHVTCSMTCCSSRRQFSPGYADPVRHRRSDTSRFALYCLAVHVHPADAYSPLPRLILMLAVPCFALVSLLSSPAPRPRCWWHCFRGARSLSHFRTDGAHLDGNQVPRRWSLDRLALRRIDGAHSGVYRVPRHLPRSTRGAWS